MIRSITLTLSILICLLLAGPALAQLQFVEGEGSGTASSPLGGPSSMTQSADPNTIDTAITCHFGDGGDDAFFRLYDLDGEFGLSGEVCVQSVDYGVRGTHPTGTTTATANVYCLNDGDAFILANIIQVGTNTIPQPQADDEFFNIAVGGCCDAATQSMAIEIVGSFIHGFNESGETEQSYVLCPGIGFSELTGLQDLGFPDFHLVQVANVVASQVPMLSPWSLALLGTGLLAVLALAFTLRRRYSAA